MGRKYGLPHEAAGNVMEQGDPGMPLLRPIVFTTS
jgi:hypothetical protein